MHVEYGAAREDEKRKTTEKVHGCSEGGSAEGCCDFLTAGLTYNEISGTYTVL